MSDLYMDEHLFDNPRRSPTSKNYSETPPQHRGVPKPPPRIVIEPARNGFLAYLNHSQHATLGNGSVSDSPYVFSNMEELVEFLKKEYNCE